MRVKVQTEKVTPPVKSVVVMGAIGHTIIQFIFHEGAHTVLASVDCYKSSRLSAGELTELIRGLTCLRNRLQEGDTK